MRALVSLAAGGVFGLGLVVSDMIDPARVRAFLDVAGGAWDPTLAFVMAGALLVMGVAWRVAAGRARPSYGEDFPPPTAGEIDLRLICGAALFGVGWGLVGFCPGPALAALAVGGMQVSVFVVAMLIGMMLHARLASRG